MSDTKAVSTTPGSLPENYRQILYWTITGNPSRIIALQVSSIPLFLAFGWIFYRLALTIGKLPDHLQFGIPEIGSIGIGVPLTFILHELVHGLVMRGFGARPQYGVLWKQLMFYATSPGFAFQRNAYLLIALAPLVGLSLLGILGMVALRGTFWVAVFALCAVINGAGAIGDLWITLIVIRYPANAYVMDERDGIRVFLPVH